MLTAVVAARPLAADEEPRVVAVLEQDVLLAVCRTEPGGELRIIRQAHCNRPFSADVTSCSLINQQCWIARIFSQNALYEVLRRYLKFDHNSLLGTGVMSQQICLFPIENVLGGAKVTPPGTFSMGNGRNSMVRNSGGQQAIVIKLEISSTCKYLIQYILGENLGNPT